MRAIPLLFLTGTLLAAQPVMARDQETPEKPVTQSEPDVVDVATTPAGDLNIRRDQIPPLLLTAQARPYDLAGLSRCRALIRAVTDLDALLGPDIDLPQEERDRISAGRVAQSVVGSFIPFRGIIREISGANDQQRRMQLAIQAGLARRGFLKGVGKERDCAWPARPVTAKALAEYRASQQAEKDERK